MFAIFGMEHYRAVLVVQMFVDIGTCFLIADMARRLVSPRAAKAAFLAGGALSVPGQLCGRRFDRDAGNFLYRAGLGFCHRRAGTTDQERLRPWLGCGLAIAAAILLRPDGGLLLVAIELYLVVLLVRAWRDKTRASRPRPHGLPVSHICCGLVLILGVRFSGAAGSLGLAQSAHPASLSAAGAALCQ